jgi:hypothetical protein
LRSDGFKNYDRVFRRCVLFNLSENSVQFRAVGDVYLRSPIVIPIEREVVRGGTLNVRLTVSPGDGFFAIWDTFVSVSPDG